MDFSQFDTRRYPTVSVQEGYGEWASTYESIVQKVMDIDLLERVETIQWAQARKTIDLACGTGRIGEWLKGKGVATLDGLDLTPEMLDKARERGIYRHLFTGDMLHTSLPEGAYDLVTAVLADEHLPDIRPLYAEAARITTPDAAFAHVSYHPFFLMTGMPTHFNRATGESVAIQTYVHLISDHVQAGCAAGWTLVEMHERLIDDTFLAVKPKWTQHRNRPFSFITVWRKQP